MNGIGQFLMHQDHKVYGYDRTESRATKKLADLGAQITYKNTPDHFEHTLRKHGLTPENTLVIYSSAVRSKDNYPLKFFTSKKHKCIDRGDMLGFISKESDAMIIAGTHGKSTSSIILGHILHQGLKKPHCFVGALSIQKPENYWKGNCNKTIIEGDEYAKAMLKMHPNTLALTSMDADHLDIFGTEEELQACFKRFAEKVPPSKRVIHADIPIEGYTYGVDRNADFEAHSLRFDAQKMMYRFQLKTPFGNVDDVCFPMPGRHNVENALCALSIACLNGITPKEAAQRIANFPGIQRRFELVCASKGKALFHDFAHHPTEIERILSEMRHIFKGKKIATVFQPHLFSRTQHFLKEFAEVLSGFDLLMIMPIYPAREAPIPGISSQLLLGRITQEKRFAVTSALEITHLLESEDWDVLITMGAGEDLNDVCISLKKYLAS